MGNPADYEKNGVKFFVDTRFNKRKSAEEGRPIYDEIEKVKILIPGDTKNSPVFPAHGQSSCRDDEGGFLTYAQLYEKAYSKFRQGMDHHGSGTPLTELPFISAARRRSLNDQNVFTAEQLASLDGTNLTKLGMDARKLKNQAQAYLDKAAGMADFSSLAAENAELKARLEALENSAKPAAKPKVKAKPAQAEEDYAEDGPFAGWDADTLRAWLKDQGKEPDGRLGIGSLLAMANEEHARLKEEREVA